MIAALLPLAVAVPLALSPVASAACSSTQQGIVDGVNAALDATGGNNCNTGAAGQGNWQDVAANIVNILSMIVGVIAVVMIIVGGFRYITSGGDSGNVSGAKNTLIYAIVGLVIVALAQFIVHFVLDTVS
ncbi:MAG TPA: pilin [Candidatus Saccharimonadales bacterium]